MTPSSSNLARLLEPTLLGKVGFLIDRALSLPFPGWAHSRMAARARTELSTRARQLAAGDTYGSSWAPYRAAVRDRTNAGWNPQWGSADLANIPANVTLVARARDAVRNNPYAKSAVKAYRRNVIGKGITARAQVRDPAGKLDREKGQQIDRLWKRWIKSKNACDTEKRMTLWEKQRLAVTELVTVGEHFIVLAYQPGGGGEEGQVGLKLQSYEPEQLWSANILNAQTGNQIRGGIEVDDHGAPVAYYFLKKAWNDLYGLQTYVPDRIEAWRVLHLCDRDRVRQTRGVTFFDASLNEINDLDKFRVATLDAATLESYIALIINKQTLGGGGPGTLNAPAGLSGNAAGQPVDDDGNRLATFQRAMVFEGLPGEDVKGLQPQRPGNNYDPFVQEHLKAVSAGVGLGKEVVSRDFSGANYSQQRQALLEDRREYETMQELLVVQLLDPIREAFIRTAWLEGKLDLPGFEQRGAAGERGDERYLVTSWHCDGWQWIDPEKEANAAQIRLQNNLDTLGEILAEQGKDRDEVLDHRAEEVQMQKDRGIDPLELDGTNKPPAPAVESGDGKPAPLNGEQITAALEVFNKLRDGSLTPAAAEQLLVAVGIEPGQAASTVKGMPIGKDDSSAAKEYLRKVVLALLLDPATRAVVVNSVDVAGKDGLAGLTGMPVSKKPYEEPYLPVVSPAGDLVSGEVLKDQAGDVVGGKPLETPAKAEPKTPGQAGAGDQQHVDQPGQKGQDGVDQTQDEKSHGSPGAEDKP